MSVQLESIAFNHDTSQHTHDALNARRNAAQALPSPEWQRGVTTTAQESAAVYSAPAVSGHAVTIMVDLSRTIPHLKHAKVRALDMNAGGGCLYQILVSLGLGDWIRPRNAGLMGAVKAREVTFGPSGHTGPIPFQLIDHRLATSGVDTDITLWRWQYKLPNGNWTDMGMTQHEAFTVVGTPTAPWQQAPASPSNTQLPWTDVLRHACAWARGTYTIDDASAKVTQRVYALGPSVVTYDCPGNGSSHYSAGNFDATAFLDRLAGGPGNGIYVNCSDCATFVSAFSNILGADLWQSRMGYGFLLNPLLAIGSSVWQTACGWGSFSYHEIAWKGACTANEYIYDACLQVDSDADPKVAPHTAQLPMNMRFGNPGDLDYRDRLSPGGNCNPQPSTRARRVVV